MYDIRIDFKLLRNKLLWWSRIGSGRRGVYKTNEGRVDSIVGRVF